MPPRFSAVVERARAPANVALAVAVVLAIVAGYALQSVTGTYALSFLGIITIGVATPTTLQNHDLLPDRPGSAVGQVVVACIASFGLYLALFAAARNAVGATEAAAVAFVATALFATAVARSFE